MAKKNANSSENVKRKCKFEMQNVVRGRKEGEDVVFLLNKTSDWIRILIKEYIN